MMMFSHWSIVDKSKGTQNPYSPTNLSYIDLDPRMVCK